MNAATTVPPEFPLSDMPTFPSPDDTLENAHANAKELLRVLSNVGEQRVQFGDGPVHVLIKLLVVQELARRALAFIEAAHQLIDALRDAVQLIVELLIRKQF